MIDTLRLDERDRAALLALNENLRALASEVDALRAEVADAGKRGSVLDRLGIAIERHMRFTR